MHAWLRIAAVSVGLFATSIARDALPQAPADAGAAPRDPELQAAVDAFVTSVKNAQLGVAIVDVSSGRVVASYHEHEPLNPASNAKLYTAAAALSMLHGDHRYETTVSGSAKAGAAGALTLRGYGDPSLSSDDLAAMAHDLHEQGLRRVDGDVWVEQKFFDDQTTPPAFEQKPGEWAAFRAPVAAVSVDENTVTLTVRSASQGEQAHAWFSPPGFVDVEGTVSTGGVGADTVVLGLSPNGKRLSAKLSGSVGEDAKTVRYTRRVDDPSLLAGYALKAELERAGIKVSGDVKQGSAKGPVILRHASAPLSTLLYALGKNSDNFYAEMVFKSLAAEQKSKPGKSADAAELVAKWLEKIGVSEPGTIIKNGSGLYDANRVTAMETANLLRWAARTPSVGPEFAAQLAIGGVDGTLHKRFRAEKTRRAVRAKTGTLDDVIALSGYVAGPPGKPTYAFCVFANKVEGRASSTRIATDKLVSKIAKNLWGE